MEEELRSILRHALERLDSGFEAEAVLEDILDELDELADSE